MLKKSFYTLVLFTAIFMSVNCKRRITTRPTPTNIDYDVSSVTRTIIREMMRKFSADLVQWKQKNIPIDDADMEDILTGPPTGKNYSIEYGKISVTRDPLDVPDNSKNIEIICEFGDKLQVLMPLPNLTFKGYFNVATENSMPVEYKYSIVINDVKINFITEFNYDINDTTSSDTKSHIDLSYEPITINLEMPENNEYAAYTEVNGISKNIVSAIKTVLQEKSTLLLEDAGVLRLCGHPKTYIAQYYQPFTTEEQQRFYYYMSNIPTESCALLGMHINTIKIKGLWNFSSVAAKLYSNNYMDFKLQIDDIEGETHWGYFIGDEKNMKFDESNFNMNIMLIEAQMYIHDSRPHAMHIHGDVILEDTSNNSSVALLNEILSKKLKSVILSKLESDIWERF